MKEILNTYRWIKVPVFQPDLTQSWQKNIADLREHHEKECLFLINFARDRFGKTLTHSVSCDLPEIETFSQESYYELDRKHLKTTQAMIDEIRDLARQHMLSTIALTAPYSASSHQ